MDEFVVEGVVDVLFSLYIVVSVYVLFSVALEQRGKKLNMFAQFIHGGC